MKDAGTLRAAETCGEGQAEDGEFRFSKVGYHIHGPTRDCMWEGWFSAEFLADPIPGWVIDWVSCTEEYIDGLATIARNFKGVLVKEQSTGRVWRLTGESFRDCNQTMFTGKWPD
jgi:hypothetical protein